LAHVSQRVLAARPSSGTNHGKTPEKLVVLLALIPAFSPGEKVIAAGSFLLSNRY